MAKIRVTASGPASVKGEWQPPKVISFAEWEAERKDELAIRPGRKV